MATPKKILVFGATGAIGKFIIQEIVNAKSSFDKIGLFTSKSTVENKSAEINAWKDKGVEIIVGDVNSEEDVANAYQGYDAVISALGRNAILTQIPLVKVAEASSTIQHFYPSEYGTDIEYGPSSANEKPHQLKLQVRKYIRENTKKLKITHLVTGPYSDMWLGPSPVKQAGSFDIKDKKATVIATGDEKISFTTMRDVGLLLVAALKTPIENHERTLKVNSFTTTPNKAVKEFEKQMEAKWEVNHSSLEQVKKEEGEAWEKGLPIATLFTLRRIWAEGGTLYDERDNGKINFKDSDLETLEEQVSKAIAKAK